MCTLNVRTEWPLITMAALGNEPVAFDLRDESADPRAEFDPLGVELNRRAELAARAAAVVERIGSDDLLQVSKRFTEKTTANRRSPE